MNTLNFNEHALKATNPQSQLAMVGNMVLQNSRSNLNIVNENLQSQINFYKQKIEEERQLSEQMDPTKDPNYERLKLQELKNTIFYDPEDNEVNYRANKIYNNTTKVIFSGAGTVNEDKEVENLRRMQQSLAHSKALTNQIEQKKLAKLAEQEAVREKEEMERKALERIERRKLMCPDVDKAVEARIKSENNALLTNTLTQNISNTLNKIPLQQNIQAPRFVQTSSTGNMMTNMAETIQGQNQMTSTAMVMPPQFIPQRQNQVFMNQQMGSNETMRRDFSEQYNFQPDQTAMPHMDSFKRKEVFDDKFYIDDLVKEIRERLSSEINFKMQQFHEEMLTSSNMIKKEILNLRDVALKVNQEKNHIDTEIKGLRKQVLNLHYEDEIRTNELMKALTSEDNYKILPTDTFYRDSSGKIKDVDKIDDDYIQYMDYLANGTGSRNLKEQRRFIPLSEYEDVYKDEYYGKKDSDYDSLLDYNNKLSNYYNF